MMWRRAGVLVLPAVAPLLLACAGAAPLAGERASPAHNPGTIAYLDAGGCIAWIPLSAGVAGRACPAARGRVSAITWLDDRTIAYLTPELTRTAWRAIRTDTGEDIALYPVESPRVYQVGAPQFYSVLGDRIDIVEGAAVFTSADGGERRTLLAPGPGRGAVAMVTWSPDGEGAVLAEGAAKALWVVSRAGGEPRRIAAASSGIVSWYVPAAGAMPHADLTCTLPGESTWRCEPQPWKPAEGDAAVPGEEVVLAWSACPGATGYELEISGPGGVVVHRRISAAQAQRFTPPGPGTYTWRVRARIGTAPGPWGPPRTLTLPSERLEAEGQRFEVGG